MPFRVQDRGASNRYMKRKLGSCCTDLVGQEPTDLIQLPKALVLLHLIPISEHSCLVGELAANPRIMIDCADAGTSSSSLSTSLGPPRAIRDLSACDLPIHPLGYFMTNFRSQSSRKLRNISDSARQELSLQRKPCRVRSA
jgi:hypothetical protein